MWDVSLRYTAKTSVHLLVSSLGVVRVLQAICQDLVLGAVMLVVSESAKEFNLLLLLLVVVLLRATLQQGESLSSLSIN